MISSQKTRSQAMNIDDAIERLQEICNIAAEPPKETSPETKQRIAKLCVGWYIYVYLSGFKWGQTKLYLCLSDWYYAHVVGCDNACLCIHMNYVLRLVIVLTGAISRERIASEHRLREKSSHSNKKQGRRSNDNDWEKYNTIQYNTIQYSTIQY